MYLEKYMTLIIAGVLPATMSILSTIIYRGLLPMIGGISVVYGVGVGGLYPFGTRFKFMGSTLKVQSPWSIGESKYCYDTFMVIPNPTYAQLMKADKDSVDEFYLENDIDEYYYDSDVEQDQY